MSYKKINLKAMNNNETVTGYVYVKEITEAIDKNKRPYLRLNLMDGESTVTVTKMNCKAEEFKISEGSIFIAEIKKNKTFYNLEKYGPKQEECTYTLDDFIVKAPLDSEDMYNEIINVLRQSVDGEIENTLAGLAINIYENNKEKLLYWSAAEFIHHNMYGGLLYHTVRMIRQAVCMAQVYPSLNKELLVAAVALHDIGKIKELDTDSIGVAKYTIDGQLFGHALIGIDMVKEEIQNGNYDNDKVRCLCHCIAAHHGKLEWGAISIPQIEEAAVLHYIDLIDSRVQQYEKTYETMKSGEMTEDKIFGLDNVRIYKPTDK